MNEHRHIPHKDPMWKSNFWQCVCGFKCDSVAKFDQHLINPGASAKQADVDLDLATQKGIEAGIVIGRRERALMDKHTRGAIAEEAYFNGAENKKKQFVDMLKEFKRFHDLLTDIESDHYSACISEILEKLEGE